MRGTTEPPVCSKTSALGPPWTKARAHWPMVWVPRSKTRPTADVQPWVSSHTRASPPGASALDTSAVVPQPRPGVTAPAAPPSPPFPTFNPPALTLCWVPAAPGSAPVCATESGSLHNILSGCEPGLRCRLPLIPNAASSQFPNIPARCRCTAPAAYPGAAVVTGFLAGRCPYGGLTLPRRLPANRASATVLAAKRPD